MEEELHHKIRKLIIELLPTDQCTLTNISNELSIPVRSQQLHLENHRTNFRELVMETRTEIAKHYLNDSQPFTGGCGISNWFL